jgi:homoserine/homoserine lactone efflux protein
MLHGALRASTPIVAAAATTATTAVAAAGEARGAPQPLLAAGPILRGFAVQAANPKALAFFVSLVPQFVDPHSPIALQIVILCVTSAVIEFGVLSLYTWLATRARALVGDDWGRALRCAAGAFLMAAGARLALLRSPP